MRRHYRNHTSPGLSRAQPIDHRRRRRRTQEDLVFVSSGSPSAQIPSHHGFISPAPKSSISDDSEDENHSPSAYHYYPDDPRFPSARSGPPGGGDTYMNANHTSQTTNLFHNRESHLRASTPISIGSSPPTTPLCEHKYSPSAPYLRSSVTDTTVSTALRPAFNAGQTIPDHSSLKEGSMVNHW